MKKSKKSRAPRVLTLDIETLPLTTFTWGIWEQNIAVNQIEKDWSVASWAAKFLDSDKVLYADVRNQKDLRNDKEILKKIHKILNNIDVLITQNGISFDIKKLNARFFQHGLGPVGGFRHIDIKRIAKKNFGFVSNSLEYMSSTFNTVYKKLIHHKYPGMELWKECLKGNKDAWKEMEKYNKHDVLATEELYNKMRFWDASCDLGVYYAKIPICDKCESRNCKKGGLKNNIQYYNCLDCGRYFSAMSKKNSDKMNAREAAFLKGFCSTCGSTKGFNKKDVYCTKTGMYQSYKCKNCNTRVRDTTNLLTTAQRKNILKRI